MTMRKSILIVEDELRIRFLLRDYLMKEDFNVFEASNGEEGLFIFSTQKIDLVLLDIMMPIMDGLTMLEKLREVSTVPVILLTAKGEEEDKLQGYDYGADDYMTKPFSNEELIARIKALIRRTKKRNNQEEFVYEDLKINYSTYEVFRGETLISLSKREFELLDYLVLNKGIVLSRDKILENVWGFEYIGNDNILDLYIKYLRDKIDKPYERKFIQTVRGLGFIFK